MALGVESPTVRERPSIPSRRYRFLEWFAFALVLFEGVSGLGTLYGRGSVGTILLFAMPLLVLSFASYLVVPALVYWDAKVIRSQDLDWKPRPMKWAVVVFVLTPFASVFTLLNPSLLPGLDAMGQFHASLTETPTALVTQSSSGFPAFSAIVYLFYRHHHLSSWSPSGYWWLLPGGVVLSAVVYLVTALVIPTTSLTLLGPVILLSSLFPIGIYLDSLYLRSSEYSWNPNPALQFVLALLSISVFPMSYLYPLYFAVYVWKRRAARP